MGVRLILANLVSEAALIQDQGSKAPTGRMADREGVDELDPWRGFIAMPRFQALGNFRANPRHTRLHRPSHRHDENA
jgi:hypothetical protein